MAEDQAGLAHAGCPTIRRPTRRRSSSSSARAIPKGINDWGDLIKDGVQIITPNPKTSGGARWNYLAAWAWANGSIGGDEAKIKQFVADLYAHVPVLDTGARGSTVTVRQREHRRRAAGLGKRGLSGARRIRRRQFRHRRPPQSILAEPPVAVVDANVDAKGTRKVAEAYLDYLYSAEGQTLVAKQLLPPVQAGTSSRTTVAAIRRDRSSSPSTIRFSADGPKPSLTISATAVCSTRSTSRPNKSGRHDSHPPRQGGDSDSRASFRDSD